MLVSITHTNLRIHILYVSKMAMQRNFDPKLEKIRNEIDGPPTLDQEIQNLRRISANVHAGFIFENDGLPLLQKMCLLISSTATGKIYNGWPEFGVQLGLTREQIQCIDYNFKGLQDPTYYVLLAFVQSDDSTMDKILDSLVKVGRLDIINRLMDPFTKFIDLISSRANHNEIHNSKCLPRVPLVLSPTITPKNYSNSIATTRRLTSNEDDISNVSGSSLKKKSYGSIVMLTFTKDGEKTAKKICKVFREKNPKIGVLFLEEQGKHVYSRAEEFIDDCFKQVNYVVPILTSGYIKLTNNPENMDLMENSLDTKYVYYIYSLLRFEYVKSRCCNNRVRCIVPDSQVPTIVRSNLHPTLQAWFRESDFDHFVESVLLKRF